MELLVERYTDSPFGGQRCLNLSRRHHEAFVPSGARVLTSGEMGSHHNSISAAYLDIEAISSLSQPLIQNIAR